MSKNHNLKLCCTVILTIIGCFGSVDGPQLTPVTGTVTLDNKPLVEAELFFVPTSGSGRTATAMTDENGMYTMQYSSSRMGSQLGVHDVMISKMEYDPNNENDPGRQSLPRKYQSRGTITIEITADDNTYDFDLESK